MKERNHNSLHINQTKNIMKRTSYTRFLARAAMTLLAVLFSLTGARAQQALPYEYGFEDGDLSTDGWTTQNPSGLNASEFGINSNAAKTGSNGFRFSSYNDSGTSSTQYLISPELNAPNGVTVQFYYKVSSSYTSGETFQVGYSTTDTNISSFTFGTAIDATNTDWAQTERYVFPAGTKYVAVYYSPNYQYRLYVDDFSFEIYSKPVDLTVNNLTATGATISWTAPTTTGTPTGYTYKYKKASEDNWSTEETITTTSVSLSGLTSTTTYQFRVKAKYSGSNESAYAIIDFKTDCPETYPIPYAYGFEDAAGIDCWTVDGYVGIDSQDAEFARTGNSYLMFNYTDTPPQYLISPQLSGIVNGLHVEFYYRQYTHGVETFKVGYSTTDNNPDSFTWGNEITASTSYQRFSANYPADTKYVAIQHTSDDQYYLYIDDILFEESGSCLEPSGLAISNETTTGATLSWTAGSDETAWDIYVTDDMTDVPDETTTPTYAIVSTNTYGLTNLTSCTIYYAYVRSKCSATSASAWSSAVIFHTECEPIALPYSYNCDDDELPVSWNTINTNTSYCNINLMNPSGSGTNKVLAFFRGSSTGTLVSVLPEVDAAYPLNGCQISFDACYANNNNGKLGIGIMTDPTDFSTFELIEEVDITVGLSDYGSYTYTVMLNNYTGTGHYIAIQNIHTQNGYVFVDNVTVTKLPDCIKPTNLGVNNLTTNTAVLSWTSNGSETDWTIYYKKSTDTDYTAVSVEKNPYTLEGLDAGTTYQFYVVANCSSEDASDASDVYSFTTDCETFVVDADHTFFEDFEGTNFVPNCWTNVTTVASGSTRQWRKETGYYHSSSYSAYSGYYGTIYLKMPDIKIDGDAAALSFWSFNIYADDYGKNSVVLLNGDDETELWSPESVTNEWVNTIIDLSAYKGQTISLAFKYEGNNAHGWYVDDVMVAVPANITLADNGNTNSSIIESNNGKIANVTLSGRTLYKDGDWNTIYLPFDVTIADSPLNGAIAKTLTDAEVSGEHVSLTFGDAVDVLKAGVPYIIKWAEGNNISDPKFSNVLINKTEHLISLANVIFNGNYNAFNVTSADEGIYFMAAGDDTYDGILRKAAVGRTMKPFRAYFDFSGIPATARQFILNFGDGEVSGIAELATDGESSGNWYNVNGMKLDKQPTRKGLYIQNGKKIVVK